MSGTQTVGHPWSHPGEQPAPKCLQPVVSHLGSGSVTSSRRQGSLEKKTSCKEHDWLKARTWALFLDEEICPWRLSLFSHPCLSYFLFSTSPSLFPCFLLDGSYCPQRTTSLSHQGLPSASCPPGPPKLSWDPSLLLVAHQLYQMVVTFSSYKPPILHVPSLTCGPGLSSSPLIPQSHKLPLVEGPNTCGLPPVQHFFLLPWPRLQPLALCPAFTLLALLQGNSDQVNVLLCSRGSSTRGSCLPPEQAPTPRCLSKLPVPLRSEPSFPYLWIFL